MAAAIVEKNVGGRPTDYKLEYNEQAYKLCLYLNVNDKGLAWFFNISDSELFEWIDKYEGFRNAIINAMNDQEEYLINKEKEKEKRRQYRKLPHIRKQANEYLKDKVKNDIHTRIRFNISSLIRSRIKGNNKEGVFRHLGYTVKDLIQHLEMQFKEGMTWDNYGKVWHIDHKKPDSWFNYQNQEDDEFKACWSLENLQPLFAIDNLRKGNRYVG